MTVLRGWGLPEQHLALDALVAFVDGELSPSAHDRAVAHLAGCPACAADAASQRQARAAIRAADAPSVSPQLLQALQAIPSSAELPAQPENLALTDDGQLVTVSRPERVKRFGSGPALGSSTPLGGSQQPLGTSVSSYDDAPGDSPDRRASRRTKQGASVVFSGLVLGALAFMNLPITDEDGEPLPGAPVPLPGGAFTNSVIPAAGNTALPSSTTPVGDTAPRDPQFAAVPPESAPAHSAPAPPAAATTAPPSR
ncbi:zf-HC2 domain-containing protein [Saccharopolyspora dendranthemae]|uniref:Putative zinc finger protein n=1 Tax=Saccharopolyspora dendranthemae TaxID=1181886 RepID=A0A561U1P5_9PSEU|nr:zf-HC2 domain-containing protein [Saccharopolyspora dendranthemae]TWF93250.1 putative zinc finger protein [Saccharopolyspora dendranthemae]